MKTQSKRRNHWLSELVNRVNNYNREEAMTRYLHSDAHLNFITAKNLTKYCNDSTEKLREGKVAPTLDLFCDADTFTSILTAKTRISYTECMLPVWDRNEDNWHVGDPKDVILSDSYYARLSKLSDDDLAMELESDYDCDLSLCCVHVHLDDDQLQRDYYAAVLARFRAAAEFAFAIGADSARLWMDAVRLLQPEPERPDDELGLLYGIGLIKENVAKAYARAQEAQGQLWVDIELGKMAKPRKRG